MASISLGYHVQQGRLTQSRGTSRSASRWAMSQATKANIPSPAQTPAAFARALVELLDLELPADILKRRTRLLCGPAASRLGRLHRASVQCIGKPAGYDLWRRSPPVPGGLFSVILKANPPSSASTPFGAPSLGLPVTSGEFIVCHADASSLPSGTPEDVEWGMTVFWRTIP